MVGPSSCTHSLGYKIQRVDVHSSTFLDVGTGVDEIRISMQANAIEENAIIPEDDDPDDHTPASASGSFLQSFV